uniref:Phosphoribosylaminoimidazole-succinocarboxamide synthase n=1 Tax=Wigglesworthia glossinidia brevipalpis TaxID=36870 RepID=PUR7_WIGBR|nr:RecName: Full=Phosphoribosylaminoimidazole-succinocarboxamide synthase; AltName: Full=SAICAR synthetase [Wigglesworthia glossinidia endosymbiont of Glossina brevipalpis]
MKIKKKNKIYQGKSKIIYSTNNSDVLILKFKKDMSRLNGKYIKKFDNKDIINNKFNYYIMNKISSFNIKTHILSLLSDNQVIVKKLKMIPIEFVVRNYAYGSLLKRFLIKERSFINPPILEFFFKNDGLKDPMINEYHCISFNLISENHIKKIKKILYKINNILKDIFYKAELILVDFKLEFGLFNGDLFLGDEFSLDNSRVWDKNSFKKMDKDIFREQLNENVIESYKEVANRIGCLID